MLLNVGHTRDLIIRGDISAIKEALAQSLIPENQSFEQSLYTLLKDEEITRDDALATADSQNNLLWFINNAGKVRREQSAASPQGEAGSASFTEITLNI
ncbi:Twitching motility protein (fragment) [Burkholderiales bacterium]